MAGKFGVSMADPPIRHALPQRQPDVDNPSYHGNAALHPRLAVTSHCMMPTLALISPAASRQMTAVRRRRLVAAFDRRYLREKVGKRRLRAGTTHANHAGKLQKRLGSTDVLGTRGLVCRAIFHTCTRSFRDDPGSHGNGGGPRPFAWGRGRPVLGHART